MIACIFFSACILFGITIYNAEHAHNIQIYFVTNAISSKHLFSLLFQQGNRHECASVCFRWISRYCFNEDNSFSASHVQYFQSEAYSILYFTLSHIPHHRQWLGWLLRQVGSSFIISVTGFDSWVGDNQYCDLICREDTALECKGGLWPLGIQCGA